MHINNHHANRTKMVSVKVQPNKPSPTAFLTERQLAERWQVSIKKIQRDRAVGEGVAHRKFGKSVRYALKDIEAYEQAAIRHNTSVGGEGNE